MIGIFPLLADIMLLLLTSKLPPSFGLVSLCRQVPTAAFDKVILHAVPSAARIPNNALVAHTVTSVALVPELSVAVTAAPIKFKQVREASVEPSSEIVCPLLAASANVVAPHLCKQFDRQYHLMMVEHIHY